METADHFCWKPRFRYLPVMHCEPLRISFTLSTIQFFICKRGLIFPSQKVCEKTQKTTKYDINGERNIRGHRAWGGPWVCPSPAAYPPESVFLMVEIGIGHSDDCGFHGVNACFSNFEFFKNISLPELMHVKVLCKFQSRSRETFSDEGQIVNVGRLCRVYGLC